MYTLSVTSTGFKKVTASERRISVGDTLRQDITLEVGAVAETVVVEDSGVAVNTIDGQLGKVQTQITLLPVLSGAGGRNILALATTQPGVVVGGQVGPLSVNGQRAQANNYLLNGADSNDLAINVPDAITRISPDAVAEFKVTTGAMKAEYGRNSGATVETVTKSGTNTWHFVAAEVFRNTQLNAAPFFQNSVPGGSSDFLPNGSLRRPQWNTNDFDVAGGGPIRKDKDFFFVSYLGFRRRQGVTSSATVFTDAERAAITAVATPGAKSLLALVPSANSGNTLFSAPTNSQTSDQGLVRYDHVFSDRNTFNATYFIDHSVNIDPFAFGGSPIPGFGTSGVTRYQNLIFRDTESFTPTLLNDLLASYHRRGAPGVVPLNSTTPASLGLTGIIPDDAGAAGPPRVDVTGISNFGNTIQGPQGRFDNTFHYQDTLSWQHGRHYFRFGGDARTYAQNQVFDFINNGYSSWMEAAPTRDTLRPRPDSPTS